MIDIELAREYFCHDESGRNLVWRKDKGRAKAGKIVGWINDGYRATKFCGVNVRVHRLVWMMHNGDLPEDVEIDHKDGDRLNNSISNLRIATKMQNMHNSKIRKTNSSGHKGVNWNKHHQKFQVQIMLHGRKIHGGYFNDIEMAVIAAQRLRSSIHGEFARHE